jgi:hypothetical protein
VLDAEDGFLAHAAHDLTITPLIHLQNGIFRNAFSVIPI